MPLATRTIAKGIPPRPHQPKPSQKVKKGKSKTRSTTKSSRKRVATDEGESESEPIRKKGTKSRRLEEQEESSEEEVVVSEHASKPPELVRSLDRVGIMHKTGTQVITTRPARQSRKFTSVEALNGIVTNSNYHLIFYYFYYYYLVDLHNSVAAAFPQKNKKDLQSS